MNEYPNNTHEAVLGPFKCFLEGSGHRPVKCGAKQAGAAEREREAPAEGEKPQRGRGPNSKTSPLYLHTPNNSVI